MKVQKLVYLCVLTSTLLMFLISGNAVAREKKEMKIIRLQGSYFEIGQAWGEALAADLKASIDTEIGWIAQFISKDKKDLIAMSNKLIPIAEKYDPQFIQVMQGMAKGSGLPFEEIFALRTLLELMFYCHKLPAMCTSFAVTGDVTKGGITIIGQNIDWHPEITMSLLRITWPNGVEHLSLSLGGIWEYPLSWHPSSSAFGLVSTLTVSMNETQDLNQVPISIIMNKASRQKRLEQSLSYIVNAQQNMLGFVLASAEGEIIGIESAANTYEVLYPENEVMVRANHYLTERFKPFDFFAKYWPNTYLRYNRLKVMIDKDREQITPELMMKKMANHINFPNSICTHVDPESKFQPSQTVASIIMVPEKRIVYIANGNPCETEYIKYQLDQ